MAETPTTVEEALKTERIMHLEPQPVPHIDIGSTVQDAVDAMQTAARGCVMVCEGAGDKLVGIFTERDVLLKIAGRPDRLKEPLRSYMTPNPESVDENDTVISAIQLMLKKGYRHLAVTGGSTSETRLISVRDIITFLVDHFPEEVYNLPPESDQLNVERDGA